MKRKVSAILLIGFLFAISSCNPEPKAFEKTELKYYEFVSEDGSCKPDCLREHIIFSNGLTFTKTEEKIDGEAQIRFILGKIDASKAENQIIQTANLMPKQNTGGIKCRDCPLFHLFYADKDESREFSTLASDAPEFVKDIDNQTQSALIGQTPEELFFIHFIFKKPNSDVVDYHFFPEGTVLKETFGDNNGQLTSAAVYRMKDIKRLRESVNEEFFTSTQNLNNCNENGLEYGYIEISDKSNYNLVFTCGKGTSSADTLYSDLLDITGGK